jgi:DNA gyrase/topoisomerase IV subunit B
MAKDKKYTGADILSLSDREHVRLRTQIYLGSMSPTTYNIPILTGDALTVKEVEFVPSVYKAIGEVVDNALDEFSQLSSKNKTLTFNAKPETGWYSVGDNGRGIPIDMHATGKRTPEVALGSLKAGRNFSDDKMVGVIGQNGVGAACTNYCSSDFEVTIYRDGKKYHQKFIDGADKVSPPKITNTTVTTTGTEVTFQLDPLVFKNVALPDDLMRNRAVEIAMANPDVTVVYNGEKYRFRKGLQEIISKIADGKQSYCFQVDTANVTGEIYVILDAHQSQDEQMYTWVNSSLLFDGGKCNTQFFNAFFDRVIAHLEKDAKKTKSEVTRNDIRQGLLVLASLKVRNPEYDSQAKTRLTGPDMRKEMFTLIDAEWRAFTRKHVDWFASVLERANERHHKSANKKAQEEHEKRKSQRIPGLLDATSRNRLECRLLITEGESAKGQICEVRDPATTAAFALTGKINNTWGCTPAQILAMGKLKELFAAIGVTPGKSVRRSELNYGQVVIATDADFDGDDIFTLLVCALYQSWPEMFDASYEPIVFRLCAPNVCLTKGKQRIHFASRADYEAVAHKYKGYHVDYYKGLGSMAPEDWEMILSGQTESLIPIVDDGNMRQTLELLFGNDADVRKNWITK